MNHHNCLFLFFVKKKRNYNCRGKFFALNFTLQPNRINNRANILFIAMGRAGVYIPTDPDPCWKCGSHCSGNKLDRTDQWIDSRRPRKNVRRGGRGKESLTNNRRRPWKNAPADAGRGWWSAGTCGRTLPHGKKEKVDEFWSMMSEGCAAYRCLHVRRDAAIKPLSLFLSFALPQPTLSYVARAHLI